MHRLLNSRTTFFSHLLTLCKTADHLKSLKSLLIVHGLIQHEHAQQQFLRSCFYLGSSDIALSSFGTIRKPSLKLQNLMVRCLCDRGLYEDVLSVYTRCRVSSCPSDDFTFPRVIKACSALGAFGVGKQIHSVVFRSGFEENVIIQTALMDFYAKLGCLGIACALVERMPRPDLVSWNAMISCFALHGLDQNVFEVLKRIFAADLKPNLSTLASVIPVCTRSGCLDFGKSLHGFAVKYGHSGNGFLVPALISMYSSNVDLRSARALFDCALGKNVEVWNAMISAYSQKQMPVEALGLFKEMLRSDVKPDLVTLVSIIPSCEIDRSILCGDSFHASVIKHGSENQISVLTALVSMYFKLGDITKAESLFDLVPNRDLLTWNVMVSGYVRNGLYRASASAFCEMQLAGFSPDTTSIVSVLSACTKLEAVLIGKSVHAFSIRKGIDLNVSVSNALLAFYADFCHLASMFTLFHRMNMKDGVSWNTSISGCVHGGDLERAVDLLHQMQKEGLALDLVTLICILPICCDYENLGQGMALHAYAIQKGFASDVSLTNTLISMYCKCGDLDAGRLLFELMPERCVVSWNALITGYQYHNLDNEVLVLFSQMIQEDQRPNSVTLVNVLPACCSQLEGKSIHAFAIRTGTLLETSLLTSLIVMYASFGNMKACFSTYEMGNRRDISLWNAIISAHIVTKNVRESVALFCDLLRMGILPDNITVLILISACAQLCSLELADSIMAFLIHKGFDKDVAVSNALIDLYARCGNILVARKLFDSFLGKDAISWNVMINGYGLQGDVDAVLELFLQMQSSELRPNDITFLSMLSSCSHAGVVEQAWMVFNSMMKHGIEPKMEHYACMVDLLGRTGHLDEAYEIVKGLPYKPLISMLESLLGACRIHGNVKIGEKIGRMLFQIDPENPGLFVMLSNVYAAAGQWVDANEVRSNIEGRRLRKLPGFSLLLREGHHKQEP